MSHVWTCTKRRKRRKNLVRASCEYGEIGPDEYFQLTKFNPASCAPKKFEELVALEQTQGELYIRRVQITRSLAEKILTFIEGDELRTRGCSTFPSEALNLSGTLFTVRFCMHMIAGKRGGWYILESQGREPPIEREFIEYGPKRKSGGRKSRYRRNLSYSEQNQVDFLKAKTPTLEQMYRWMIRKYPNDVLKVDYGFSRF